ncbi:MAG: hypothetical protein JXR25_08285 [Pontiellaceae bacterium]|nr:hypothetical protein [Pontiellaceae bacterium]MBN2784811.1 hypothetical protein [Pontiellaceae bacterium]
MVQVLVSADESDSEVGIEGNLQYLFCGESGTSYAIEYSTNLEFWAEFTNLTASVTWQTNRLPSDITGLPRAFIRAVH